jgi:hypothetical protein
LGRIARWGLLRLDREKRGRWGPVRRFAEKRWVRSESASSASVFRRSGNVASACSFLWERTGTGIYQGK